MSNCKKYRHSRRGRLHRQVQRHAQRRLGFALRQDEARFGRISDTCGCWAKRRIRPRVQAMLTHQYTYAYGAVSPIEGRFDSLVLPHVNGHCMKLFINKVASRYPRISW